MKSPKEEFQTEGRGSAQSFRVWLMYLLTHTHGDLYVGQNKWQLSRFHARV